MSVLKGVSTISFHNHVHSKALFALRSEKLDASDSLQNYSDLQVLSTHKQLVETSDDSKKIAKLFNWRYVLSSHYATQRPFLYEDQLFATQEHALLFYKFPCTAENDDFQLLFTAPSASTVSGGHQVQEAVKLATSKAATKKNTGIQVNLYHYDQHVDSTNRCNTLIEEIMYAKFSSDDLARQVLLATGETILIDTGKTSSVKNLTKCIRESTNDVQIELMNVRARIRDEFTGKKSS